MPDCPGTESCIECTTAIRMSCLGTQQVTLRRDFGARVGTLNIYKRVICMCWQQASLEIHIFDARGPLRSTKCKAALLLACFA